MTQPLIDDLTVTEDVQIELASARVRAYCGWHIFPSVTETLTLDGPGQRLLLLPSMYVTDVASVTEDGIELDAATYEWSETGQVWRSWPWSGHFRAITVELTHGYSAVPDEVRDVVLAVASRLPSGLSGVKQEQAGGVSRTFDSLSPLSGDERSALAAYRIPPRA